MNPTMGGAYGVSVHHCQTWLSTEGGNLRLIGANW